MALEEKITSLFYSNMEGKELYSNVDAYHFKFGFRKCTPRILQRFANIHWFLPFISIFSLIQGMIVTGFISASVPHIEREFGFSSTDSGIMLASNDLTGFLFVLFVSYYGEFGRKPLWIGIGCIITGIGALLFSLPKFLKGPYMPTITSGRPFQDLGLCHINRTAINKIADICNTSQGSTLYLAIFCIANMLMGIGATPLHTLGATYLDENVSPKNSPIYIGLWYLMIILGPSIGLSTAGGFLTQYVDPEKDPGGLSLFSPLWVGRWWLPFATISWVLIFNGFVLMMFPKKMPGSIKLRQKAIRRGDIPNDSMELEKVRKAGFCGFVKATLILVKNKYLMVALLASCAKMFVAAGVSPFFSKFLIVKYGADPLAANSMLGVVLMVGSFFGLAVGSILMRNLNIKESVKKATILAIVLGFFEIGISFGYHVDGCTSLKLVNNDRALVSTKGLVNGSLCNDGCGCSQQLYNPVCNNGVTYLSPCFAGCKTKTNTSVKNYAECSCVSPDPLSDQYTASHGKCGQDCKNIYMFTLVVAVTIVASFLTVTPKNMIVLRSVPANQRSFAMGLQFLLMRLLGMLPGPIVVGQSFDATCLVWKYDECGRKTNCAEYELGGLSNRLVNVAVVGNVIHTILFIAAFFLCKESVNEVVDYEETVDSKFKTFTVVDKEH